MPTPAALALAARFVAALYHAPLAGARTRSGPFTTSPVGPKSMTAPRSSWHGRRQRLPNCWWSRAGHSAMLTEKGRQAAEPSPTTVRHAGAQQCWHRRSRIVLAALRNAKRVCSDAGAQAPDVACEAAASRGPSFDAGLSPAGSVRRVARLLARGKAKNLGPSATATPNALRTYGFCGARPVTPCMAHLDFVRRCANKQSQSPLPSWLMAS
jgi:hypothetical protein